MNFSFSEILFFLFLGLLLVGPRKLPQIARTIGVVIAQFKRATADLEAQITTELKQTEAQLRVKSSISPVGAAAPAVASPLMASEASDSRA